jgi:hypothetical protein
VPVLLQKVEPAKMSFLNSSTNVSLGQVPETVIGDVPKRWPSVGLLMVAAVLGGGPGISPVKPTEPDSGGGLAADTE